MASARDTPTAVTTAAAGPHAQLADAWHEQTEYEVAVAYDQGYQQALADVAGRIIELHTLWVPIGRRAYADRVRERLEQMEAAGAKSPGSTWRGRYPGGPVDFETGRIVQRTAARQHIREAA